MKAHSPRPPVEDVLVVGAGVAALAAALSARAFGAQVRIVGSPRGLSHRASGAWDAGDPMTLPAPLSASLLGLHREAQQAVLHALGAMHTLATDARSQPLVATIEGRLRRVGSSDANILNLAGKARIAIAQVEGCGFDARALSRALNEHAGEPRFFVIDVEYGRRTQDAFANASTAIARSLDDASSARRFIEAMRRALGGHAADAILTPPILGFDAPVAEALERALKLPVGEVVASHSIQSERLTHKLRNALRAIDSSWSEVDVVAQREAKRGVVLRLTSGASLIAPQLVLATGRAQHPGGVMVDTDACALEGAPTSSRSRYAGTALRHLDPRHGVALGLVAASGWWAGMCAAKHVSQ